MNSSQSNEVCILFGVSGCGKSSTINQLCGETKCAVGDDESSQTQYCKLVSVDKQGSPLSGKHLLDMQGFNDTRPDQNQEKIYEMMKLYFMQCEIKKVKCIILFANMSDTKTDFYEKYAKFLGQLFTEEVVRKNSLVLLTKCDRFPDLEERQRKLANIKGSLSRLEDRYGWSMQMIEWSNKNPLPNQEKQLIDAISRLPGFDPKSILLQEEKKIDAAAKELYESNENIEMVHHDAGKELRDYTVDREVEDCIAVDRSDIVDNIIPAQTEVRQVTGEKVLHLTGHFGEAEKGIWNACKNGLLRTGALVAGPVMLATGNRSYQTQKSNVEFEYPVLRIRFDKNENDIFLLDRVSYKINQSNPKIVEVEAEFSWGGGQVLSWDFNLKVTADMEHTVVLKEQHTEKIVVKNQEVKKVKKTITETKQKLEEVKEAWDEKIYKRTLKDIRQDLIRKRIMAIM
jgi:GTP-binding protein EngB required for normal cell division